MWESYRRGDEVHTTINAPLEDWQSWFLGKDKRMPAGRFYADVLTRAIEELQDKMPVVVFVTTLKRGRKVVGYEIMITDTSIKPN